VERYPWPGNVRELRAAIDRAVAVAYGDLVNAGDLPPEVAAAAAAAPAHALPIDDSGDIEGRRVRDALEQAAGNQARAAEVLGGSRRTQVTKPASGPARAVRRDRE